MARNDEDKARSCCTWPKIIIAAIILIGGGIAVWQLAPIDSAIQNVIPTFNNTGSAGGSGPGNSGAPPTDSPTQEPDYDFIQCADPFGDDCCNGLDGGFCDFRVNEVMYATTHNANADFETGFLFSPNHNFKLEDSLEAGYRGINVDVCNCGGELVLCHGVCSFGLRDIVEVFSGINSFLDENPSEVLVVPIELNSEAGQAVDIDELYSIMLQAPGFMDKMYEHSNSTVEWPTLGELVSTNQRVILFHFRGPSCDEADTCPPGFHWYHRYAVNTRFDLSTVEEASDTQNSCAFARTPSIAGRTFFGVNNFVTPPVPSDAEIMNEYDYISSRIDECSAINDDLEVNFVYIDFWSQGDLPRLVQDRNIARLGNALSP